MGDMTVVKIRAELANGEVYVGPIMGNGGMIGSGALHAGYKLAGKQASRMIRLCQDCVVDGRDLPVFEPRPGHVAIYPDFCAETDGERVYIPIDGTTFSIEPVSS